MTVSTTIPGRRLGGLRRRGIDDPGRADSLSSAESARGLEHAVRERIKELSCLYGISRLVDKHRHSLTDLLEAIVRLLPPSWQYPEVCQARLTLYDDCYRTEGFRQSSWVQAAPIRVQSRKVGLVEVFYLEEMPDEAEGPFLREERDLINAIAELAGNVVERFQFQQQLEVERLALEQANLALRRALRQIEAEKAEICRSINANVENVIAPLLQALASEIPRRQRQYVSLLRKRLDDLTTPFVHCVSKAGTNLTAVEVEICSMIQDGMTTKEIARLRHVAPATVSKQRERIRRKLGITGNEANLFAHLRAVSDPT